MSDDDTYLSAVEIERITRAKYGKIQCKRLAEMGWKFAPDAEGHPLVLRAYHDERFGLDGKAGRRPRPRLAGLASV